MHQGLANGIILLLVVLFFAGRFAWTKFLRPRETAGDESFQNVDALYKKKTSFRIGVLVFSLCALLAMYTSDSRLVPLILLLFAGGCQLGAMKQNTRKAFAKRMEEKMETRL